MAKRTKKTYSGKYPVKNLKKYSGDPTNVIYRSLWERRVMEYLDTSPFVKLWGSEEKVIPYKSTLDGRVHRYFMDFVALIETPTGEHKKYLLEVKPHKETILPVKPKRMSKSYTYAMETYIKNQDKWKAASAYSKTYDYTFKIITEHELKHMNIF